VTRRERSSLGAIQRNPRRADVRHQALGNSAAARQRLSLMLAGLASLGAPVEGDLGSSSPLEAMEKVLADDQFDEIIVATLPPRVSRWLQAGLPHQARRRFGRPVTTIITSC
jgi:hypothetical protein